MRLTRTLRRYTEVNYKPAKQDQPHSMTPRQRKLAGTVILLIFLTVYALIALAVAIVLQVHQANKLVELAFYAIAGLAWVIPAAFLVTWMQRNP